MTFMPGYSFLPVQTLQLARLKPTLSPRESVHPCASGWAPMRPGFPPSDSAFSSSSDTHQLREPSAMIGASRPMVPGSRHPASISQPRLGNEGATATRALDYRILEPVIKHLDVIDDGDLHMGSKLTAIATRACSAKWCCSSHSRSLSSIRFAVLAWLRIPTIPITLGVQPLGDRRSGGGPGGAPLCRTAVLLGQPRR